jgi:lipopolysaccharide/colanic/teichoic acid biosynthesis glycosyltransferase
VNQRYGPVKRALDVAGATLALLLSAPLSIVVALVILATLGRPVLFRQTRPGRAAQPFQLVKFRTMRLADPAVGNSMAAALDGLRLTRAGRTLRALSLDELPTLWNVLRGDMSLVGPRPLLTEYLDRYTPEQARRHEVRPGITGLAQIRGRNALNWEQRFTFDIWYVEHRSLALDLRILAGTVSAVLRRRGITAEGTVTAREWVPAIPRPAAPSTAPTTAPIPSPVAEDAR